MSGMFCSSHSKKRKFFLFFFKKKFFQIKNLKKLEEKFGEVLQKETV
jgi:hypothetical protein